MWCLRMWCLIIIVSWRYYILFCSVTSMSNLLLSNTTSSNTTSLNSRNIAVHNNDTPNTHNNDNDNNRLKHEHARTHEHTHRHTHVWWALLISWNDINAYNEVIMHPVSVRRFPSFRTQPLENLSHYLWKKTISEQPSPWRKSWERESCNGDRV